MTTQTSERIPQLTLGWRLKMALDDMPRAEMAERLGVNPGTLSRWMADKGTPPKRAYLAQWAFITGVPLTWLETGAAPVPTPPTDGKPTDREAALAQLAEKKRSRTRRPASTAEYVTAAA